MEVNMITQLELKRLFKYNPDTGDFIRKVSLSSRCKVGDVAGTTVSKGYVMIAIKGRSYYAHRLAWLDAHGKWPDVIDHINHIKSDNRIANLRNTTQKENCKNMLKSKKNVSGITGVCWYKKTRRWRSQIRAFGKKVHLGYFADKFEAICASKSAENKYKFHENHGS